jgi:hypothetical protein
LEEALCPALDAEVGGPSRHEFADVAAPASGHFSVGSPLRTSVTADYFDIVGLAGRMPSVQLRGLPKSKC